MSAEPMIEAALDPEGLMKPGKLFFSGEGLNGAAC